MRQSIGAACPFDYIIVGFGFFLLGFVPEFHRRLIYTNIDKTDGNTNHKERVIQVIDRILL